MQRLSSDTLIPESICNLCIVASQLQFFNTTHFEICPQEWQQSLDGIKESFSIFFCSKWKLSGSNTDLMSLSHFYLWSVNGGYM